jgi:hypothetical protein
MTQTDVDEAEIQVTAREQRRNRIGLAVLTVLDLAGNTPMTTDEISKGVWKTEESYSIREIEVAIKWLLNTRSLEFTTARRTYDFRAVVQIKGYGQIKARVKGGVA